ncbi:B3 domain-containing protein At3g19184-like isoform X1 [Macadamia integrifolia]|uniref:B3 domain-containing protein At3g19184-like isoform X1 n=1 Tax=Macadamia integrifolia TaxID=60698 RepID=UPI001C4F5A87|nr:B3 domain-containing protein At3g19184-like isoform X1 [Macadamia integrifolia]XP_042499848.1 B3 domain-containing protein At3g19184-like isoform X2 [Macadamia integrifolia]XP_042499851.1 B3 domain-containing protein At3g19184-like isoform X1 [Macadamia integrifolia]
MAKSTYEEMRRKRLEENKKRMEDLNLSKLAQTLKNSSPKPSPMKKPGTPRMVRHQVDLAIVRRSSRVANKPAPVYKEVTNEFFERPRSRIFNYKRRDLSNRVYASDEAREYAAQKAEELQSSLDPNIPSFVKPMLQSHVTGGFWLGLPNQFCKANLSKRDERIILEDENDEEYETLFLAQKTGLSAGWRGFAIAHELVDGDALVFQLVKPTKFKVYIIRVYGSDKADRSPDSTN